MMALSACALVAGCGDETSLAGRSAALTAPPVQLLYARAYNYGCSSCVRWGGVIAGANLAYDKQGTVIARRDGSTRFVEVGARYAQPLPDGRELWIFDGVGDAGTTEFAVRYRVLGGEYWDSLDGKNYFARTANIDGLGEVGSEQPLGGALNIAVATAAISEPTPENPRRTLNVQALVRNLAYEKQVTLVASTDGWTTVENIVGSYRYGTGAGERWDLSTDFDAARSEVRFAVSVRMAGDTFWDNDFTRDFTCKLDAKLGSWRCAGLPLISCGGAGCAAIPEL